MKLGTFGKVVGLFMVIQCLTVWILGLGMMGILSQLELSMAPSTTASQAADQTMSDVQHSPFTLSHAKTVTMMYVFITCGALTVGGVLVLRHWLYRPISTLVTGVDRIVDSGDLGHRIFVEHSQEFNHVAEGINQLAKDLNVLADGLDGVPSQPGSGKEA